MYTTKETYLYEKRNAKKHLTAMPVVSHMTKETYISDKEDLCT